MAKTNDSEAKPTPQKKGRPTRTRREAEAERYRPLVPADRKLAKRIEREKRNEAYAKEQLALQTGDEAHLPWRDQGRVRRYTRNRIDARWSFSEFILPAMLLFLVASMAMNFFVMPRYPDVGAVSSLVFIIALYALFFASAIEGYIVWQGTKKQLARKYPNDPIPKRTWFYAYSRMIMARRWRSPRPQVERGESLD